MRPLLPMRPADVGDVAAFLTIADLTLSGLDDPGVRLWLLRSSTGAIAGTTGFELSATGSDAIVRSVAVSPAERAWLYSQLADEVAWSREL